VIAPTSLCDMARIAVSLIEIVRLVWGDLTTRTELVKIAKPERHILQYQLRLNHCQCTFQRDDT